MTAPLMLPAEPHRRSAVRMASWWGRAFERVVEEMAYDENQLAGARTLARSGRVSGILVETGRLAAGVEDERGLWTVSGTSPVLSDDEMAALIEVLGARPGRRDALLAGALPAEVAEHLEEAGVGLVPDELSAVCTCGHWHVICVHALGVLLQVGWHLERDAGVLLHLRGLPPGDLLARLSSPTAPAEPPKVRDGVGIDDVEVAADAVLRARRLLDE